MTNTHEALHQDVLWSLKGPTFAHSVHYDHIPKSTKMLSFSWSAVVSAIFLVILDTASSSATPSPATVVSSDLGNFAVVRPFSASDADKLANSFFVWNDLPPCAADNDDETEGFSASRVPEADLFLVFGQSIDLSSEAQEAISLVKEMFNQTNGWNGCFGKITALGAGIEPQFDIYDPSVQETNPYWVNGPNRQFERTIRLIQTEEYDAVYLMEGDSVPVADAWLDSLLADIDKHRPFDVLGSRYRGDNWDPFLGTLDEALVKHINGNAIYNLTGDSLLPTIVKQLEDEADGSIPYDLRISQLALSKGYSGIKETEVIANFASTNILSRHIPPNAVIVHGAKIHEPWNGTGSFGGDLTLVVTSWDDPDASFLLSHLEDGSHPFSNIVVMIPSGSDAPDLEVELPIPITYHNRNDDEFDYMDLCSATTAVPTDYYMLTNSYHRVRPNATPMMTNDGRLVIPFAPTTEEYCFRHPSCVKNMEHAQSLSPTYQKVVQDYDMIYETQFVQEMCSVWKEMHGVNGRRLLSTNISGPTADEAPQTPPAAPSAMAYVAFLEGLGAADEVFSFSDATQYGTRPIFVRIPTLSNIQGNRRLAAVGNSTNSTSTGCTVEVTQDDCLDSPLDCEWRSLFDSCHDKPPSDSGNNAFHNLSMNLIGVGSLSEEEMIVWQDSTSSFVSSFYDLDRADDVETIILSQTVTEPGRNRRILTETTNIIKYKQRYVTESAASKATEAIQASGTSLAESLSSPFESSSDIASYVSLLQDNAEDALGVSAFSTIESVSEVDVASDPDNLEQPNDGDAFEPGTPTGRERRVGFIGMIVGIAGGAVILVALIALFLQRRRGYYDSTPVFEIDDGSIGTMDVIHDFHRGYRDGHHSSGNVYSRRGDIVPVSPTEFDL